MQRDWLKLTCLTALAGALWFLAQGLHPHWWAAWLAPIPALYAASRSRALGAFAIGAAASLIGFASLVPYFWAVALPGPTLLIGTLSTLAGGYTVALAAGAWRRWPPIVAVFVYPLALAGIDFVAAAASPHGTAGSLAYTQMECLPALQIACIGGPSAIVFLLGLPASAVATALTRARGARPAAAAAAALAAALLAWGTVRLTPSTAPAETVALLASDQFDGIPSDWSRVLAAYAPFIDRAVAGGARIVVLPEKIAALPPGDWNAGAAALAAKARAAHAVLVMGVLAVQADGTRWNRALVALPDGQVRTYDKQHLVPGWEASLTPGHGTLMLPGQIGIAICKDYDFARPARDYATLGARLMVAPAWDFRGPWGEDGYLHGRLAVLRGVEDGFTVARAARDGRLTVSDRTGRVLAEAASSPSMGMLIASAPLPQEGPTIYARVGNVFGAACAALTAVVTVMALRSRTQAAQA